ncbi:MAG: ankyrin repeat domain-containing protein [Planctomycetota bacterium]|jgi:ankyrin repeat protein|nr:ankyrin repeat domain-containing protein [Planctomycetota bacterium]
MKSPSDKIIVFLSVICPLILTGCQGPQTPEKIYTTKAEKSYLEKIRSFLDGGGDVNFADSKGDTELHKAAYKGHRYVAETLLERGANPKAKNENGRTPLHYAAMYGRTDVAELLLGEEIDVNAKDNDGLTPLYWANKYKRNEAAELLTQNGGK